MAPAADPIPAIVEADATGETAALFADIRQTLGLPVVNLVWRHLATRPGALEWTWAALKPYYQSGAIEGAAASFLSRMNHKPIAHLNSDHLIAAGIDLDDQDVVRAIVDSYHRGNSFNIVALSIPLCDASIVPATLKPGSAPNVDGVKIPTLPAMNGLPPHVQNLVDDLNELGKVPSDPVIASMYRHLAPWPGLLPVISALFQPLEQSGQLSEMIDEAAMGALSHARAVVLESGEEIDIDAAPDGVREVLEHFTANVIARMIPICGLLRLALSRD